MLFGKIQEQLAPARTQHHPRWQGSHLHASEQFDLAMRDLSSRKESTHNHQRRQPREGKDFRRRLVSRLARQGSRRTFSKRATAARQEIKEAAAKFVEEVPVLTQGERGPKWLKDYELKSNRIILPFLGEKHLAEDTSGVIQDYRIWRAQNCKTGRAPARSTRHQEIVCIRQVLKNARRHGWVDRLPDLSEPFRPSPKTFHRAWFSPEEYKQLCEATRKRARDPRRPRFRWEAEQLHRYVLFSANTGLHPVEAIRLQFRDVTVVEDESSGETILEIEVRGTRGIGYCVSTLDAVQPFERLKTRAGPDGEPGRSGSRSASVAKGEWREPGPTDLLFPKWPRDSFNAILHEEKLRTDRDGKPRTAYSLRHTYICLRFPRCKHLSDRQELSDKCGDD
jgi:integrase